MLYLLTWCVWIWGNRNTSNTSISLVRWISRSLLFPLGTIILTEILSAFGLVNIINIRILTVLFFVIFIFYFKPKIKVFNNIKIVPVEIICFYFIVFTLLLSAAMYAPINEDANFYHLPRIIHWLDHGDLNHYITSITHQIYQPYLIEIQLLWIYGTFGGINFINLIQVIYFIQIYYLIFLILNILLKVDKRKSIIISLVSLILVNSLFLQANMPKNDVALTYFVIGSILGLILLFFNSIFKQEYLNLVLTSSTCMILSKGFGYVYLLAAIISVFILTFFKFGQFKQIIYNIRWLKFIAIILLLLFICTPTFYRNYNTAGHITGQTSKEVNYDRYDKFSIGQTLGNLTKFAFTTINNPFWNNNNILKLSSGIHKFLGIDQDMGNFRQIPFVLSDCRTLTGFYSPMSGGNFILFVVVLFVIVNILIFHRDKLNFNAYFYFILLWMLIGFFLIFSLFRWQPWMTRYYNPIFVFVSLGCLFSLYKSGNKVLLNIVTIFALINFSVGIFLGHNDQPILPISAINRDVNKSMILKDNYRATMGVKYDYWGLAPIDSLLSQGNLKVGLIVNGADPVFGIMRNNRELNNHFSYNTNHLASLAFDIDRIRHKKDFNITESNVIIFNKDYTDKIPDSFRILNGKDSYYRIAVR